jgi:hypothetical protein
MESNNMRFTANRHRDRYAFSLNGMAAINPYVIVPAVPDDEINRAWDSRLGQPVNTAAQAEPPRAPRRVTRGLESVLARYFAPGRRQTA